MLAENSVPTDRDSHQVGRHPKSEAREEGATRRRLGPLHFGL